jgi:hypothetical protein
LGAEIIGGRCSAHNTGHNETYWSKFTEIIRLGYIPVCVAKELGILNDAWLPPCIDTLEDEIKKGVYKLLHT